MRSARLLAPALLAAAACAVPADRAPSARDQEVVTVEDQPITFRLDAHDPDGDPLTWVAAPPGHGTIDVDGDLATYTPAPDYAGRDLIDVLVSDGERAALARVVVDVAPVADPPRVRHDTYPAVEDEPLYLATHALLANDVDPDGDPLRIVAVTPIDGGTIAMGDDEVVFTPAPDRSGLARFGYTVSDGRHQVSAQVVLRIGAINDGPRLVADVVTTDEDTALELTQAALLRNDHDPDGDSLSVVEVDDAQGGSVELREGVIRFAPAPDFHGTAGFLYRASDGRVDAAGWVTVVVGGIDDLPITDDLALVGLEDRPVIVPTSFLREQATDGDGDPLLVIAVDQPAQGTVALIGDQVRFMPTPDVSGAAGFRYLVSDGVHQTAGWADISLGAVDDAPVALGRALAVDAGAEVEVPLAGRDVDSAELVPEVIAEPAHGALASGGAGALVYQAPPGFAGEDELTFVVHADGLTSAPARVVFVVAAVAACGDGTVDAGEACDDGNWRDGDGCDRTCALTGCGNGVLAAPIITGARLRWLGASCNGTTKLPGGPTGADAPIVLSIDGVDVLTVAGGDGECGCDEPVRVAAIGDPATVAALAPAVGGTTAIRTFTLAVRFPGADTRLAWAELEVDAAGTTIALPLFAAEPRVPGAPWPTELCAGDLAIDAAATTAWTLGEACDDGNDVAGDGCSPTCTLE